MTVTDRPRTHSAASRPISLELVPPAARSSVANEWRTLERRCGPPRVATSWSWTETWLEHYGESVPHWFAVATRDGEVCGLALVTMSWDGRGPLRVRLLHVGTAGEPSGEGVYVVSNGFLSAPEDQPAVAAALVSALRRHGGWGRLDLERLAPDHAAALLAAWPRLTSRSERCPAVDLRLADTCGGEVLATLRPRTRNQIRGALRRLGDVGIEVADGAEQSLAFLDELMDLHEHRWRRAHLPGAFASPRVRAFHRDLLCRLAPRGMAMLVRVRSEIGTVGCIYNLVQGREVLSYHMGLMHADDPKLKPGFVAHLSCMQACYERGFDEYNFLPEPTGFKLELSNCEREMVSLSGDRLMPRVVLLRLARSAKRLLRHFAH